MSLDTTVYQVGDLVTNDPIVALLAKLRGTRLILMWRDSQAELLRPACRFILELNDPEVFREASRAMGGRIDILPTDERMYYLPADGADYLVAYAAGLKLWRQL